MAGAPESITCKTRLCYDDLWSCLAENPRMCPSSQQYGAEFFCTSQYAGRFRLPRETRDGEKPRPQLSAGTSFLGNVGRNGSHALPASYHLSTGKHR